MSVDWLHPFSFDWQSIYDSVVTVLVLYPFLIVALRIAGVRSMSQMNNFDWIVTVALGTVFGSAIMLDKVTIWGAVSAILSLLVFQWVLTKATRNSPRFEDRLKADPVVLVEDGEFVSANLDAARVSRGEIRSAIREAGHDGLSGIARVVLEPDASLSVLAKSAST